jgi:hypothetical protein
VPAALKAYVGWVGDPTHWVAHTEFDDDPTLGERMECHSQAEAVAWARERTDWVLVITDSLQWARSLDKQPSDVPRLWQQL